MNARSYSFGIVVVMSASLWMIVVVVVVVVMCMLANLSLYGPLWWWSWSWWWRRLASFFMFKILCANPNPVCCDDGHSHGGGAGTANRDPIVLHLPHDDHGSDCGGHDLQLYVFLSLYGPRIYSFILLWFHATLIFIWVLGFLIYWFRKWNSWNFPFPLTETNAIGEGALVSASQTWQMSITYMSTAIFREDAIVAANMAVRKMKCTERITMMTQLR